MPRVILVVLGVAVTIYGFIDTLQSDDRDVRVMPKPFWATVIVLVPVLGALAWLVFGRPQPNEPNWWDSLSRGKFGTRATRARTTAPDDDAEFLSALEGPQLGLHTDEHRGPDTRQRDERRNRDDGPARPKPPGKDAPVRDDAPAHDDTRECKDDRTPPDDTPGR